MKGKWLKCYPFKALVIALVYFIPSHAFAQCEQALLADFLEIETQSVTIKIIDNNPSPIAWEYEIGETGFSPDQMADGTTIIQEFQIDNLNSGTAYDVYLRTICTPGDSSVWNGPFGFYTTISNLEPCYLSLDIPDNNCGLNNQFPIEIVGFGNSIIGQDIFIQSLGVTISHSFPEDLDISLISPDNKRITISSDNGLGSIDYGNPMDSLCFQIAAFSDQACEAIEEAIPPFIGQFQPEESFAEFNGSIADGTWILEICDKDMGDVGKLHYAKINLSSITCPVPTNMYFSEIHADSVVIEWPAPINCQAMLINYGPAGFIQGTENIEFITCTLETFTITNLDPETDYDIYLSTVCSGSESPFSCQFSFTTSCHNISYLENFDDYITCQPSCVDSCKLTGAWTNILGDDTDWIIYADATPTEFTGPDADYKGSGNFAYIENQMQFCSPLAEAIIESPCIQFKSNHDGCDLSFAYHMFGTDVNRLELLISVDNKITWDTIFSKIGEQSSNWLRETLDLSAYDTKSGFLRFCGSGADGNFGDIAIDDLNFYASVFDAAASIYYIDADLDGYGNQASDEFYYCVDTIPLGFANNNLDCNDSDDSINPSAVEINCNSIDENCNGSVNETNGVGMISIVDANIVAETCDGSSDGSIGLILEGGVAPFEYMWSNGSQNATAINLSAGIYSCTIQDNTGCITAVDSLEVMISNALSYEIIDLNNVTCLDTQNGSISIEVSGGSSNYSYAWSNGVSGSPTISGLSEGMYHLSITDALACELITESITIIEAEVFTAVVDSIQHIDCSGDGSGYIALNTTGISPVEQILWSTGDQDLDQLSNLNGGYYSVTVSSDDGCESMIDSIFVLEPDPLEFRIEAIEDIICFGGTNGSIDITISGGTMPYTYNWSNGTENEDLNNVASGFYFVEVIDANGCIINSSPILVSSFDPIQITVDSLNHVSCPGSQNGYLELSCTGGGGEYVYLWNESTFADSNKVIDAPAGLYVVTVVDRFGCKSDIGSYQIGLLDIPIPLQYELVDSNLCFGDATADIALEANTNNFPAEINWSNGTVQLSFSGTDTLFNLPASNYALTVTDSEGCTGVLEDINIDQPDKINFFSLVVQRSCPEVDDGSIILSMEGGTPPFRFNWSNGESTSQISDLAAGIYSCEIIDANDCILETQEFFIDEIDPLEVELSTYFAAEDSIIVTAQVSGGNFPHFCFWSSDLIVDDDGCSVLLNGSGEISLQVLDANQCMFESNYLIDISTESTETIINRQSLLINNISSHHLSFRPLDVSEITVFDTWGNKRNSTIVNLNDGLEISNLPSGVYFIHYRNKSKNYIERFIKI